MGIDFTSSEPFYKQLAGLLRQQIREEDLKPGVHLPSERELMEEHAVSRTTVRLAIGELVNEGLVVTGQGRRSSVRPRPPFLVYPAWLSDSPSRRKQHDEDTFRIDLREQGQTGLQHITVERSSPEPEVAERLRLNTGEQVLVRRRLHVVNGYPTQTGDSYYPLRLVEGTPITEPKDVPGGTNRILEELGHGPSRISDRITVRMPTPEERGQLRIGPEIPVACIHRVAYDAGGHPVEFYLQVMPGDRNVLAYELPLE